MNINLRRRRRNPSLGLAIAAATLVCCAACRGPGALQLHFLAQIVPGSHRIFGPATIAIAPPQGRGIGARAAVGEVIDQNGGLQQRLYVEGLGPLVADALVTASADAGLKPLALDAPPADARPPQGANVLLECDLRRIEVNKRFGPRTTVHGREFVMHAIVTLRVAIFDRSGKTLYVGDISGREDEPPAPVGAEVFLPLETEPAESLSVALSRAVGSILLEPTVRPLFHPAGPQPPPA